MPLVSCRKCSGTGRPPLQSNRCRCDLCQGRGDLAADFAERTASPRREGFYTSCDRCFELGTCLPVERGGITEYLCGSCWIEVLYPELAHPATEPVPF